jgi:hypothetical protein
VRKAWRVVGMAVTAGMLTASVAACGASSGGDAPANGLVLYNGQHEQTTQAHPVTSSTPRTPRR